MEACIQYILIPPWTFPYDISKGVNNFKWLVLLLVRANLHICFGHNGPCAEHPDTVLTNLLCIILHTVHLRRSCGSKNVGGGGNVFAPLYHNGGKRHRHRISWDKILKRSMNFKTYRRPPLVRKMLKRNDNMVSQQQAVRMLSNMIVLLNKNNNCKILIIKSTE